MRPNLPPQNVQRRVHLVMSSSLLPPSVLGWTGFEEIARHTDIVAEEITCLFANVSNVEQSLAAMLVGASWDGELFWFHVQTPFVHVRKAPMPLPTRKMQSQQMTLTILSDTAHLLSI